MLIHLSVLYLAPLVFRDEKANWAQRHHDVDLELRRLESLQTLDAVAIQKQELRELI